MADTAALDYHTEAGKVLERALGPRKRTDAELSKIATWDEARLSAYTLAGQYYRGDQESKITDRLKQWLERNDVPYCENFAASVVDAMVDRLVVEGVGTDLDKDGSDDDLGSWLWSNVWDGSQGDERGIDLHHGAVLYGDYFVIVDFDNKKRRPRWTLNSPDICRIEYDNGEKLYAVKKWYTNEKGPSNPTGLRVCRLNVYLPDVIEKWYRLHDDRKANEGEQGGWQEWIDEPEEGVESVWPTPWMTDDDEPIGIPVFHFTNHRDRRSMYGVSELRAVYPQQDRLNKELIDLAAILDQQGWPQRWATGLDSTETLRSNPGEVWKAPSDTAKFGQFDAAPLDGPLKAIESTMLRLSTRSRTPSYLLFLTGSDVPSGEALKTAEGGLVSKIERFETYAGNQHVEAMRMSARLAFIFGNPEERPPADLEQIEKCSITINWRDPHTRNEKEHLETLQLMMALGIPAEYLWDKIDGLDVEKVKQLKKQEEEAAAAAAASFFDRGGPANPGDPGQTGARPGMPGLPGGPPVGPKPPKLAGGFDA